MAGAANEESYLLLRRGGGLWGVAHAAVRGLSRQGSGYRVEVGPRPLLADEVVGVVTGLRVRPAVAALRRFWPEAACGLAVHETGPLVIVDPASPPRALTAELEPSADEGDGHG
jgi:hypothetical protein